MGEDDDDGHVVKGWVNTQLREFQQWHPSTDDDEIGADALRVGDGIRVPDLDVPIRKQRAERGKQRLVVNDQDVRSITRVGWQGFTSSFGFVRHLQQMAVPATTNVGDH